MATLKEIRQRIGYAIARAENAAEEALAEVAHLRQAVADLTEHIDAPVPDPEPEPQPEPEPEPPDPDPSDVEPVVVVDFARYADTAALHEDAQTFTVTEDKHLDRISLVDDERFGKAMRYDWLASDVGSPELTIGRNVPLPTDQRKRVLASEVWLRLSTNFSVRGTVENKNPDWKTLFHRQYGGSGRAAWHAGVHPGERLLMTGNGQYPEGQKWGFGSLDELRDGVWHQFRFLTALSSAPGVKDGVLRLWIDGVLRSEIPDFDAGTWSTLYGIAIGRNMNAGPPHAQHALWGPIRIWNRDPGWG